MHVANVFAFHECPRALMCEMTYLFFHILYSYLMINVFVQLSCPSLFAADFMNLTRQI